MGKKKTKRFGALRPSPIASLSDQAITAQFDVGGELSSDNVQSSMASIIEKLQAPNSEEKECGCQLLASFVTQRKSIEVLLKENAVKIVAPLFLDPSLEVRGSALGALRNVCVHGDEDIHDRMVACDVLTPLTALIKQYESGWMSEKNSPIVTGSCDVLIEALGLLSNLCEGSSKAVQIFNKENFLPSLLPLMRVEDYGYPLALATARLLYIVSEDNPAVTSVLQTGEFPHSLIALVAVTPSGVDAVLLRTFVMGILLNLPEVELGAQYQGIVQALASAVEMDCLALVMTALGGSKDTQASSESADTWPEVLRLIQAQGIALELLANFCCSEDDWEEMECEGSSDDQDLATPEGACEEGMEESALCLPSEIHTAFLKSAVLSKILNKTHPVEKPQRDELQKSQAGQNVLDRLTDLQSRALLCLSNVLSALDGSALSQAQPSLASVWAQLYTLAKAAHEWPTVDENQSWAVSSAMRATLQRLAQTDTEQFGAVSESDVNFLISFGARCKNHETQINVVRIVSTVGCVLAVHDPPHPLLARIGAVLLDVACGCEDLLVVAEALDSIFDVFKDDHTDTVVRQAGLVTRLKALQPSFKAKVNSQRKKLGESYGIVMMAKSNLAAYIKYKTSH